MQWEKKKKEGNASPLSLSRVKDLINMGAQSQQPPRHCHHTSRTAATSNTNPLIAVTKRAVQAEATHKHTCSHRPHSARVVRRRTSTRQPHFFHQRNVRMDVQLAVRGIPGHLPGKDLKETGPHFHAKSTAARGSPCAAPTRPPLSQASAPVNVEVSQGAQS